MRMRREGVARIGKDKRAVSRPHQCNYRDDETVLCVGRVVFEVTVTMMATVVMKPR